MRFYKQLTAVCVIAILALATSACPSSNTPYGKAIAVGLDITDSIHTGADTVDKLRLNGTITVDEERAFLQYAGAVNNATINVYGPCVQAAHLAGDKKDGFVACASSLASSLTDPQLLNSVHITNPKSQQTVSQLIQAVVNLANTGVAAIQAAKGN